MSSPVVQNFMRQQGFADEPPDACNMHFAGLYFQPRIVFPLVLLAILLQSRWLFLALAAVLFWNVARAAPQSLRAGLQPLRRRAPRHAAPRSRPRTPPLRPGHRGRLHLGRRRVPPAGMDRRLLGVPGLPGRGLLGPSLRKFCLGAWVFHVLRGEVAFANSTLPWARGRSLTGLPTS